jgi:sulfite oxidase
MPPESLIVRTEQPLNAETPLDALCRSHVTPTPLFFVRNHGPVPAVDAESYRLTVDGDVRRPLVLSLRELRERWPAETVTATIACAGNRRNELASVPNGVPWGAGAIGNAVWTGVRLSDLLRAAGASAAARHVAFTGLDRTVANGSFGGSIPIARALAPEVLLAYEMSGEPLPPEHGFPLRAVVPGYVGARSVKWLAAISVRRSPSPSFFQRRDYLLGGRPLAEQVLNSAFCLPIDGPAVRGYAVGGGGRPVERVDISVDGGRSWSPATLETGGEPWTWRLWHANVGTRYVPGTDELVVRAWDGSSDGQPEDPATVWNERGYMNNAWHRVLLTRG